MTERYWSLEDLLCLPPFRCTNDPLTFDVQNSKALDFQLDCRTRQPSYSKYDRHFPDILSTELIRIGEQFAFPILKICSYEKCMIETRLRCYLKIQFIKDSLLNLREKLSNRF